MSRDELLLDFDPLTGMKEWISTDEATGQSFIRYEQDCSSILDDNKAADTHGELDRRSDFWHVAKVPSIVILKWITEHGVDLFNPDHKEGVRRLLNSSEYAYLKRAPIVI